MEAEARYWGALRPISLNPQHQVADSHPGLTYLLLVHRAETEGRILRAEPYSFGMLGLGFDATDMDPMDVKTAFRMLALRYHPVTRTRMTLRQHHQACMNRDQATASSFPTSEHGELISEISF